MVRTEGPNSVVPSQESTHPSVQLSTREIDQAEQESRRARVVSDPEVAPAFAELDRLQGLQAEAIQQAGSQFSPAVARLTSELDRTMQKVLVLAHQVAWPQVQPEYSRFGSAPLSLPSIRPRSSV